MRASLFHTVSRGLLALLAGCAAVPVIAAASPAAAAPPAGCGAATPEALAEFFDGTADRLERDRVPGAVVSVVSGGRTVFAKGYGMADAEHRVPMSESRSLVRIASISKLFTWTAVMQQVEAGRLDLDADVNRYLKGFRVPATYPEPITLAHLMNHTAGFEEQIIGTAARTADDMPALREYLAGNMPARIRPAGEVTAYSNYGAALAGYVVAEVSGEPYEDYVQRHLLDPLAMTHSTAAQPVPGRLAADLARSYDSEERPPRRIPFIFDTMAPDGSVSATATDMARFMTAHLRGGRYGTASILSPATAERMHARSFAADRRLGGWAHGFMDRTMNGHRVLMHDGAWEGFASALVLVPGCDLGVFVGTNATGGIATVGDLMPKFFDRFTPDVPASAPAAGSDTAGTPTVAGPRAGFYLPARHNETGVETLTALLGSTRLTVNGDGTVRFRGKTWKPAGDGLYRATDDSDHLVFLKGSGGRRYVATDGPTFELRAQHQTPMVNLIVVLAFLVPALTALALPVVALVRRLRRRPATTSTAWRTGRALAGGAAALGIVFVVGLGVTLFGDTSEFLYGAPTSFAVLLALPILVLAAAAAATAATVVGWRGSGAGLTARIHQVVLLAGTGALAWFLWQWNLIGWQYA